MGKNANLIRAKAAGKDEFYTQLSDIENELRHYKEHFKDKVIYCNCDDPRVSNFFKFFSLNFERLRLKKLITTCYKSQEMDLFSRHDVERAIMLEYHGDQDGNHMPDPHEINVIPLQGDGNFQSAECIELLKQADIVCTNPPFSLFRKYVAQLTEYDKKFLIIGRQDQITYQDVFPLIKENEMWPGVESGAREYQVPKHYEDKINRIDNEGNRFVKMGNACWYTNLEHGRRHEDLTLYKKYSPEEYPKYENYDAIEVGKVSEIPRDYEGVMGVPITFLNKHNPEQFEIMGLGTGSLGKSLGIGKPTKEHMNLERRMKNRKNTSLRWGAVYYLRDGVPHKPAPGRLIIRNKRLS